MAQRGPAPGLEPEPEPERPDGGSPCIRRSVDVAIGGAHLDGHRVDAGVGVGAAGGDPHADDVAATVSIAPKDGAFADIVEGLDGIVAEEIPQQGDLGGDPDRVGTVGLAIAGGRVGLEKRRTHAVGIVGRRGALGQDVDDGRLKTQRGAGQQVIDVDITRPPVIALDMVVKTVGGVAEQAVAIGQPKRNDRGLTDEVDHLGVEVAGRGAWLGRLGKGAGIVGEGQALRNRVQPVDELADPGEPRGVTVTDVAKLDGAA